MSTIFLYNSELWIMTDNLCTTVDILQRVFLRFIINATKLDKIRNIDLYQKCQTRCWSETIKIRRLRFLGHLLRLDPNTPARKALDEFFRPVRRDPGRPPTTWWAVITKDLKKLGIPSNITELSALAADRGRWRRLTARCVQ